MSAALETIVRDRHGMVVVDLPVLSEIVLAPDVKIPAGIVDLATFREWTIEDEFPQHARIDFLQDQIWVDLSMEHVYEHNQPKTIIAAVLILLVQQLGLGRFFGDGVRFSNGAYGISTEPDAMFATFETFKSGRLKQIAGRRRGVTELFGIPDMVLEVLSDFSEEKDTTRLPELYRKAGIREFWRVDARGDSNIFEIKVLGEDEYVAAEQLDGWQRSVVFGKWFKLLRTTDKLGDAIYDLVMKD